MLVEYAQTAEGGENVTTHTGRYDYLDGLRAIAIGSVLSLHWLAWYVPFFHGGSIGVDVFFVLSGFIITTMLWRSSGVTLLGEWWSFIRRRVLRLYPALLGLVLVTVTLYAAVPFAPLDATEVVRRGLLALGQVTSLYAAGESGSLWLPALHPFSQTWSLAIEWYFYLLWPLAVIGARRIGWSASRLAGASVVAAAALYVASLPLPAFWFYFGPSARFAELLVGSALALWFQSQGVPTRQWRSATFVSVALLVAIGGYCLFGPGGASPVYRWVGIPLTVVATVTLIHTGYGNPGGPAHRLLSHPWLATVGRHSYSLYLWHVVPMLLLEDAWPALPKPVVGAIAVALTVVLTIASYRLLEAPFMRPRSDVLSPAHRERVASRSL